MPQWQTQTEAIERLSRAGLKLQGAYLKKLEERGPPFLQGLFGLLQQPPAGPAPVPGTQLLPNSAALGGCISH